MHTVLVTGGYGFFGRRICQALASNAQIYLIIAGRDAAKARRLADQLNLKPEQGIAVDAHSKELTTLLKELKVDTVIHTAGPFQGQDYFVAQASILAGANYIDLADGRDFVAGIGQLDNAAREQAVLATSGASSLPALSSAVVDRYLHRFGQLKSIRHGISSGARAPGLATMQGVFSYCGKPFSRLGRGQWRTTYGWLELHRYKFPHPIGCRLLGSCDVPDLTLFPLRYKDVHTVHFHAGFASALGHLFVWTSAQLVKAKWLPSLASFAAPLNTISQKMERFVSDKGGMFVVLEGCDKNGNPLQLKWHLIAAQNHGPYIPCGAAIALANKMARGDKLPHGAMPCMGLLTVEEYLDVLKDYDIQEIPA